MSFIGLGLGALLRGTVSGWWAEYKKRHADGPMPMSRRKGVWKPNRVIPRVERLNEWAAYAGLVCIALGIFGAVYGWLHPGT